MCFLIVPLISKGSGLEAAKHSKISTNPCSKNHHLFLILLARSWMVLGSNELQEQGLLFGEDPAPSHLSTKEMELSQRLLGPDEMRVLKMSLIRTKASKFMSLKSMYFSSFVWACTMRMQQLKFSLTPQTKFWIMMLQAQTTATLDLPSDCRRFLRRHR